MKVKECSDLNLINWEEFRKVEGPGYCKLIPKWILVKLNNKWVPKINPKY